MSALFVLGGARSGKSRHAQTRIEAQPGRLAFIATAQAFDAEMAERIARHRADRGPRWETLEAPFDLPDAITRAACSADAVLIDCLTLWLSNLILTERDVAAMTGDLCAALQACPAPVALVANEVGMGIVPENALARRFRDEAGRLNQAIAALADEVVLVAAGLPLTLKSPA
ncbi:bifunctional adenosylcobinamide kinase/adenosylcobinamide-phosphate guanylyltransferase [Novosphingobium beihaiensis]|uniref:Bifunctional adenosylcobalamin biosynthesis protein n=1 Tax=Novosphingobium beihaiensis TaxID=2930389 RepID=A0ABT0BR77_9SPHN|nr:bifunctional adenosylcobinamide kinase/adenosylcobinamide-phosphate guanylyltransferase [Novosphingobium beihaiensis]MCJ2187154.1 bifunctional adenosylcobinamide kinase/adenosylcobinamide-phosphate guanylyltransferase [Novosphingobium beihaiensis]